MKLTIDECVFLKNICCREQQFEMAARFREEEKRLVKKLPKKKLQVVPEHRKEVWVPIISRMIPFTEVSRDNYPLG